MITKEELLTKIILRTITEDDLYSFSDKYTELYDFFLSNETLLTSFSMGVGDCTHTGFCLYSDLVNNLGQDYIEVIPVGDIGALPISGWDDAIIGEINIYE